MKAITRLSLVALLCALGMPSSVAWAQSFPTRQVKIIMPYPPAQGADIIGRIVADHLSQRWGQPVVVENRAGGAGIPAIMSFKSAPADGYTLLVGGTQAITVNPNIYRKLPYDVQKDFLPVSGLYITPLVLVVHSSTGYNSVANLVDAAKRAPGKLNYASPGIGTASHMTAELFMHTAKIQMMHVVYKGSGPAMTDLLGGQVLIMLDGLAAAISHVTSGRVRALAVTTAQRVPQLPQVPTIAEQGYPGFLGVGWAGLFAPTGTPREIVDKISADVAVALNDPQTRKRVIDRGAIPDPSTPQKTAEFVRADIAQWAEVAKIANIVIDQ
jgi:tripartite-type tricarboxylate transporter receptor subunit TctC